MKKNARNFPVYASTSNTIEKLDNDNFGAQMAPHAVHLQSDRPITDEDHLSWYVRSGARAHQWN